MSYVFLLTLVLLCIYFLLPGDRAVVEIGTKEDTGIDISLPHKFGQIVDNSTIHKPSENLTQVG